MHHLNTVLKCKVRYQIDTVSIQYGIKSIRDAICPIFYKMPTYGLVESTNKYFALIIILITIIIKSISYEVLKKLFCTRLHFGVFVFIATESPERAIKALSRERSIC